MFSLFFEFFLVFDVTVSSGATFELLLQFRVLFLVVPSVCVCVCVCRCVCMYIYVYVCQVCLCPSLVPLHKPGKNCMICKLQCV